MKKKIQNIEVKEQKAHKIQEENQKKHKKILKAQIKIANRLKGIDIKEATEKENE